MVLNPRGMLSKSQMRQIKKSRTKVSGKKVVTDDVNKLKSLKVTPDLPDTEKVNYYKEPIWIEYYIPKESRFAYEVKFLYVKLIDVIPREEDRFLKEALTNDLFFDVIVIKETNPDLAGIISSSYKNTMSWLDTMSFQIHQYYADDDPQYLKSILYLTETLIKYEPTIASLQIFGEFAMYNLNWLIRRLNSYNIEYSLEDETVSLLIKRRNIFWDENNFPEDPDFELFSALFYEQAFPYRGADELQAEDFLLD